MSSVEIRKKCANSQKKEKQIQIEMNKHSETKPL